jgi:hypothetical protein
LPIKRQEGYIDLFLERTKIYRNKGKERKIQILQMQRQPVKKYDEQMQFEI